MLKYVNENDPSFLVKFQTLDDIDAVISKFNAEFVGLSINWSGFTITDQNWISLYENPFYDQSKAHEDEFYYRYIIEFSAKSTTDVNLQDTLASHIEQGLINLRYQFVILGK